MLRNHSLRERIVQEMLLRRFPAVRPPARILQAVRIVAPADREAEHNEVCRMPGVPPIEVGASARHAAGTTPGGAQMLWERHSEASTATVLLAPDIDAAPFRDWLERLPGEVVRAVNIAVVATEKDAEAALTEAALAGDDLVTCYLGDSRFWSDFRMGPDGYGRVVIAANGTLPADLGRIVQRVQELGNYRNLALLGLPLAQEQGPILDRLETLVAEHALAIAEGPEEDEVVLERLSDLSAKLAHVAAGTAFRLGATRAYAAIVADRLETLDVRAIPSHQSLADFNDRRLVPAVRTCANFAARLELLGDRAARVTALLRTRIETRIERQNRDLLGSMERGIGLQIRLQSVVESLSVLAISYYAIGLIAYLAKGISHAIPDVSADVLTAFAVIPVVVTIYVLIHRFRSKILPLASNDRDPIV